LITRQNNGFQFVQLLRISHTQIGNFKPLAGSFAIVECEEENLLCYNKRRQQWELPAGTREDGETPLECAKRELFEETGQIVFEMEFKGLDMVLNSSTSQIKYNPIYFSTINNLRPFRQNSETTDIRLWDLKEDLHIDDVDFFILESLKGGRP
jgi:8-oxo-dGTP diphosphatase